jgi:hypothetical protein
MTGGSPPVITGAVNEDTTKTWLELYNYSNINIFFKINISI